MKRIIIVESDFIIAFALKRVIQRLGHEVMATLNNGKAVIAKVKEDQADLILIELRLSGEMDGIEAMKQIRRFSEVPVIYMTGLPLESIKSQAQQTRPAGYLSKPISAKDMEELIKKVFDLNR